MQSLISDISEFSLFTYSFSKYLLVSYYTAVSALGSGDRVAYSLVLWKRRDNDYFYFIGEGTKAQKFCLANLIQQQLHLLSAYRVSSQTVE